MTSARRQLTEDLPEPMTAEEFFAMPDDGSGTKYQLVNGYLVAMAPVPPVHSLLHAELTYLIRAHLKAQNSSCWVGTETGVQPIIRNNHAEPDFVGRSPVAIKREGNGSQPVDVRNDGLR
jgi:Uma2 family endonuclease